MKKNIATLICIFLCLGISAQKKPKKELYVPMDYSTCGYHASEQPIPEVPAAVTVAWSAGDCWASIQQAIDKVSAMKADRQGHRGAVVLGEGTFRIDRPLRITTSGVVLRGQGKQKTTIVKYGVERGALIYIEGRNNQVPFSRRNGERDRGRDTQDDRPRLAGHIAAGSTTLPLQGLDALGPLQAGDRVTITRPSTREWIESLHQEDFGGGLDYTGWKPTDVDITWDRTIVAVDGSTITIDSPITTTVSSEYGGAFISRHDHGGEITECGIERLTLASAVNDWNPKDEDHCWDGISIDNSRDAWVRSVNFLHFAGSAVNLQRQTSRITVEDCVAAEPVSEEGGWRRCVFLTRGQQTLFQRCVSRQGIHDFAAGSCAAGPNAFVQCEGEESLGFSGSIGSWAAGLLFDIVNIDGNDLRFANLEQFQTGTGWNTANSMLWQCTASTIECYSPDSDNRNSSHGSWGTLTGNGEWTSSNDHVNPRSLFYSQLLQRLAPSEESKATVSKMVDDMARLLPRLSGIATTSPTVEQAMEMAQLSLTTPRLTLETWIDGSDTSAIPVPRWTDNETTPVETQRERQTGTAHRHPAITDGHLTFDGRLLTGNQYSIPWWNGRVKDNYVRREGKPAITRFVPGREGTGWTDRTDSVVSFLKRFHFISLDHHYGLWYDLRRIDHERVRRANGNVEAPFYEQPFARSGQGTAWDGLSRYDLTRPNRWYWHRLNQFASQGAGDGILLFNEHYFQHNILEAGAHWVDCPWRPVNNVNGTTFPEPVPFAGDKRIFMAEQFYDVRNEVLNPLHRQYIRMCLQQLQDKDNVVHLISAEYTGPLHFTRFWLETIAEWEAETGRHPLVALSCTRDAQDSIMADPVLSKTVDIIDIRYWHYNTGGLWAPQAGRNMAPRQWMRKMSAGKTGFNEVYHAVRECRDRYPDKAVTYYAQQYNENGWAVLMAGGSLPNLPFSIDTSSKAQQALLTDVSTMRPVEGTGCVALAGASSYLVYCQEADASINVRPGKYDIFSIHPRTGVMTREQKGRSLGNTMNTRSAQGKIFYIVDSGRKVQP